MNWSMYSADRTTHLKIVAVGLLVALLVSVVGIASELNLGIDSTSAQAPILIKAGAPAVFTERNGSLFR